MRAVSRSFAHFLMVIFAVTLTASAQTTFHLHKETVPSGDYLLDTNPPDAPATILQQTNVTSNANSTGWSFVSQVPVTIPSGSTLNITVWMDASSHVHGLVPDVGFSYVDSQGVYHSICYFLDSNQIATSLTKYQYSCTAGISVTNQILHFSASAYFTNGQTLKNGVTIELGVEGTSLGDYDSYVTLPQQPPAISGISPSSGPAGTSVTITGSSFGSTQGSVTFNGVGATISNWSTTGTSITATVPAGLPSGTVPVVVYTASGSASNSVNFTIPPPPVIASLSTTSGTAGVTSVTVTGTGFGASQGTGTVSFNGAIASPTSWSDTSIYVPVVPVNATTGPVVVTTVDGASNGVTFTVTPVINSISPSSAGVGAFVTLAGGGFGPTMGTSTVNFPGTGAPPSNYLAEPSKWNATTIVVPVPANATSGTVTVTVEGVTSNGVSFTLSDTGTIAGVVTQASDGSPVSGATVEAVQAGSVRGTETTAADGSYSIAFIAAGTYTVSVFPNASLSTSQTGVLVTSGKTTTVNLSVGAPTISDLSPSAGPIGAAVTIAGSNFGSSQGSSTVTINGTAATPTSWSNSTIAVPVPQNATDGPVVVTVEGVPSNGVTFVVGSGTISGTVTAASDGSAVSGATVAALQSDTVKASTATATDGTYSLGTLIPGTYDLRVSATGFGTALQTGLSVTVGADTPASVSLSAAGTLSGTVTKSDGVTPITGATVTVFQGTDTVATSTTDGTGNYNIATLSTGNYTAQASATDYDTQNPTAISITSGQTTTQNFSLTAESLIAYLYDDLGRLIGASDSQGNAADYVYDAVGNILSIAVNPSTNVSIVGFSPDSGPVGTSVTISGTGFSSDPGQDAVSFNGTSATVSSATPTQIVATVPSGATSGTISVTAPGGSATSSQSFTVTASTGEPSITSFNPAIGASGTAVTITGTNFDSSPAADAVGFNTTSAAVSTANSTTISTSVPPAATSGRISVTTASGKAISSADFFVPPPPYVATDVGYTGRATIGTSTGTITIGTTGQIGLIVFDGTAGQQLGLQIANNTNNCTISILNPNGTTLAGPANFGTGNGFLDTWTLPLTGTYTILVVETGSVTGSLSLTLNTAPTASGQTILPGDGSMSPVLVNISYPGQNVELSFHAVANQRVSIKTSPPASNPIDGAFNISIIGPDGVTIVGPVQMGTGEAFIDAHTLPVTGMYTILVDPISSATGDTNLYLYNVVDQTGSLTPSPTGAQATVNLDTPGQNGEITFSAIAGQRFSLQMLSGGTIGYAQVSIQNPMLGPLTAGQSYDIRMEYYQAGYGSLAQLEWSSHSTKKGIVPQSQLTPPNGTTGTGLKGDYFDDKYLDGGPNYTRTDPTVDFNWQGASPGGSIPGSNWSARWTGQVQAQYSEQYTFCTNTDDGARLWVNGILVVDHWVDQAPTEWCSDTPTNLSTPIVVGTNGGYMDTVTIPTTGTYTVFIDPVGTDTGSMTFTLYEVPPDDTNTITPGGSNVTVTTGTPGQNAKLTFSATAGQRISLQMTGLSGGQDGNADVSIQNPTLGPLVAGQSYPIEMDYYQGGGGSAAQLEWTSPSTLEQIIPQTQLYPPGSQTASGLQGDYFSNTSLSGTPDLTEIDPTINFNWNGASPGDSLPGTNWSARWTGQVQAQFSEQYTFCTNTDDGARLWVDGILITDHWVDQGQTEWCSGSPTDLAAPLTVGASGGFIDTVTVPTTGTYTIVVDPQGTAYGAMTLTLNDVPPDATASITLNGSSVPVSTNTPGQNADVTFSGTAGQLATVQLTNNTMGCVTVSLLPPGSTTALTSTTQCGASFNLTQESLPTTGTYTIYIDPQGTNTGSISVAATNP